MDLQLSAKLALVTGSTAGIGFAISSVLASEGATVIINGRSGTRVAEATEKIRQRHPHSKLEALIGDLSKVEAVEQGAVSKRRALCGGAGVLRNRPSQLAAQTVRHNR
jgi:short-subunit dehydrogenase